MDDLLALIAALFETFTKREPPAPAGRLGQALRDAFAERVAGPAGTGAGPAPPPAARRGPAAPAPVPGPAPPMSPVGDPGIRRAAPAAAPSAEAGRVAALFANPQSLVAAFIVAEALAKPIALRDP